MKKFKSLWLLLLLPVLVGLLVNWLTPIDIPGATWKALKWFCSLFIIELILPVWGIILLILAIPLLIGVISIAASRSSEEKHLIYTSDTFFGVSWHWQYVGGRLYDDKIIPRCLHCHTVLQAIQGSAYGVNDDVSLSCHHCGFKKRFDFNYRTLIDRIKREIDRKIVTKEYIGVQQGTPADS